MIDATMMVFFLISLSSSLGNASVNLSINAKETKIGDTIPELSETVTDTYSSLRPPSLPKNLNNPVIETSMYLEYEPDPKFRHSLEWLTRARNLLSDTTIFLRTFLEPILNLKAETSN